MFTARYGLSPYITRLRFVLKRLKCLVSLRNFRENIQLILGNKTREWTVSSLSLANFIQSMLYVIAYM